MTESLNSSASGLQAPQGGDSLEFDYRLECLMTAIMEDWAELEAKEVDGTLVVCVREGVPLCRRLEP